MVLSIFNNLGYPLIGSILLYHIHLADWRFQDIRIQQYEWRHWKDHHHYHQHYHPKLWWTMKANKAIIRNCRVKMKWTQSKKKLLQGSPILCFGLDAGWCWDMLTSHDQSARALAEPLLGLRQFQCLVVAHPRVITWGISERNGRVVSMQRNRVREKERERERKKKQ